RTKGKLQMRKYLKLLFIIFIFFLLLTSLRLLWMKNLSFETFSGISEAGSLDLSTYSAQDETLYPLDGEWLYYPNELLTAEESKTKIHDDETRAYPHGWIEETETTEYKYGTFYMQLSLPDNLLEENLSIYVPKIKLASKLYIDGNLVGSAGNPARTLETFEASMSSYIAHFQPKRETIDVVLQVSNDGTR